MESKHLEKAMSLRSEMICPNCAETILMSYSDELKLDPNQAKALGTNFGGGMKCGGMCGAITSSLLVLGALGINDPRIINEFINRIKNNHDGLTDCKDLLRVNMEKGLAKKPHCDAMIKEAIELIEEYSKK